MRYGISDVCFWHKADIGWIAARLALRGRRVTDADVADVAAMARRGLMQNTDSAA